MNDVLSEAVNDVLSEAVNDVPSQAVNDVLSEAVNDVLSEAVNDVLSETVSDVLSEAGILNCGFLGTILGPLLFLNDLPQYHKKVTLIFILKIRVFATKTKMPTKL